MYRTSTIVTKPFRMSKHLYRTSTNLTYVFRMSKPVSPVLKYLSRMSIRVYSTSHISISTNVYHRHKAFLDVKTLAQNVYQPHICFSGYQNLCPERLPSSNSFVNTQPFRIPKRMVTTLTSMCVQNVYQPAHCFRISKCVFRTPTDVNTRVQNVYHCHQAFPDVITLLQYVYQTHISFPDIKTRVPNVYLPQIAFPKVNTSTQNFSGCQNERLPP